MIKSYTFQSRQFTFQQQKPQYPLELKGNMRRSHTMINSLKTSHSYQKDSSLKDILTHKINNNTHELHEMRNIVPYQHPKNKTKKSAIRTYQSMQEGLSGIAYLMEKKGSDSTQKGKKCAYLDSGIGQYRYYKHAQKKHYNQQNEHQAKQNNGDKNQCNQNNKQCSDKHVNNNVQIKIDRDLHSSIHHHYHHNILGKKISNKDMRKQGYQLGYDHKYRQQLSTQKLRQLMGSQYLFNKVSRKSVKRCDWRKSNITFG